VGVECTFGGAGFAVDMYLVEYQTSFVSYCGVIKTIQV